MINDAQEKDVANFIDEVVQGAEGSRREIRDGKDWDKGEVQTTEHKMGCGNSWKSGGTPIYVRAGVGDGNEENLVREKAVRKVVRVLIEEHSGNRDVL